MKDKGEEGRKCRGQGRSLEVWSECRTIKKISEGSLRYFLVYSTAEALSNYHQAALNHYFKKPQKRLSHKVFAPDHYF